MHSTALSFRIGKNQGWVTTRRYKFGSWAGCVRELEAIPWEVDQLGNSEVVSSPTATGGGGEHFEQHVDAFALALLLVQASPPVITNTSVVEVHLQTRHLGWHTDDLLVVGKTGSGKQRKLAAQIKSTFTVSAANDDCRQTFQGMWDDFVCTSSKPVGPQVRFSAPLCG